LPCNLHALLAEDRNCLGEGKHCTCFFFISCSLLYFFQSSETCK